MEKPVTLRIEELKNKVAEIINASELPAFILDYIMRDFYIEIHGMAQNQIMQDSKAYEASLIERKKELESEK